MRYKPEIMKDWADKLKAKLPPNHDVKVMISSYDFGCGLAVFPPDEKPMGYRFGVILTDSGYKEVPDLTDEAIDQIAAEWAQNGSTSQLVS